MKHKKLIILLSLLAASLLLTGCGGRSTTPSSWPGITVADNVVYLAYNQFIYGVQANNGTERTRLPEEPINGSTTFFHRPLLLDENTLLIGDYKKEIYSFDISTQTADEFFTGADGRWIATPLIVDGTIYAPNTDKSLYALDTTGAVLWTFKTEEPIWASPVINEELLYIASMDKTLYALNSENGMVVWSTELGGAVVSPPYLGDDGNLYIGTFNNEVLALDSQEGNILWRFETEDWVWGTPVLSDGILYITDLSGKLYAVDASDQSILWQYKGDGAISGSVLLHEGSIFFATQGGVLYCLNMEGGLRWTAALSTDDAEFAGTPIATENSILISAIGSDALLYAYNTEGTLQWQFIPEN
jgi:outer membrane protein assembly factor BamB